MSFASTQPPRQWTNTWLPWGNNSAVIAPPMRRAKSRLFTRQCTVSGSPSAFAPSKSSTLPRLWLWRSKGCPTPPFRRCRSRTLRRKARWTWPRRRRRRWARHLSWPTTPTLTGWPQRRGSRAESGLSSAAMTSGACCVPGSGRSTRKPVVAPQLPSTRSCLLPSWVPWPRQRVSNLRSITLDSSSCVTRPSRWKPPARHCS
mmetsp:Transcript_9475/g.21675  ORF Transcript_9475/g.21675 Transcript_9475/m.21675 type:complete len:202 (-) Transcript_9475:667-1272(-)